MQATVSVLLLTQLPRGFIAGLSDLPNQWRCNSDTVCWKTAGEIGGRVPHLHFALKKSVCFCSCFGENQGKSGQLEGCCEVRRFLLLSWVALLSLKAIKTWISSFIPCFEYSVLFYSQHPDLFLLAAALSFNYFNCLQGFMKLIRVMSYSGKLTRREMHFPPSYFQIQTQMLQFGSWSPFFLPTE